MVIFFFCYRLSLANRNYEIIETPANIEYTKPYLGKLQNSVSFGIVHDHQLKIWILNESCGQMEWLLKCEAKVGHYARYVASIPYDHYSGRQQGGSWIVEENNDTHNRDHNVESQSKESYEWDSDNDDTFTVDIERQEDSDVKDLYIMGFHPYKEVVFMVEPFGVVACQRVFSSHSKFQKSATVAITSNLTIHAWSIKCRRKKTNYTIWLEITKQTF